MIDLRYRSGEKELLDRGDIPFEDIRQNMHELNIVNTMLGGHRITIEGLKKLIATREKNGEIIVCEIGCGGGDNLNAIYTFCRRKNILAKFVGIDIKPACTAFAAQQYPSLNANWITSDYLEAKFPKAKPDIIFSSLFCHHFENPKLLQMLQWMKTNSKLGFFINDLHRHPIAYYFIRFFTNLFSKSYLVKNDAAVSVARSFKRSEWEHLFQQAGIQDYYIQWKWAFRYLIICKNEH